jgi:hypothetical protein
VPEPTARTVARLAYLAAGLNLAAGLAMLVLLRPGLPAPTTTVEARAEYVVANPVAWWLGWLVWHAAALALLAFYAGLAGLWWRWGPIRCGLALLCAAAALAVDLAGQALYVGLPPQLDVAGFGVLETAAIILTGYVANGLYTLAGVLLVWVGAAVLPRSLVALSLPVWAAGAALSATSLVQWSAGQIGSAALLIPLLALWATLVGRWLQRRAS